MLRLCLYLYLYCCQWYGWEAASRRHLFHGLWLNYYIERDPEVVFFFLYYLWLKQIQTKRGKKNTTICRWRLISVKNINNRPVNSRLSFQWFFFLVLKVEENLSSLPWQPRLSEHSKALSPLTPFQNACLILRGSSSRGKLKLERTGWSTSGSHLAVPPLEVAVATKSSYSGF